ncbi:hypothetical protein B0H17DRAFT_1200610 [Mycena rosella]|uniref:Uncharacterized protein n=1 Tax=Mycena rosella TaxID=1033263 RepID=A0AAD7GJQ2_MYCRO|nr:hypothetical protein B0H17DRAFT_1200610 [Mycena rosella]
MAGLDQNMRYTSPPAAPAGSSVPAGSPIVLHLDENFESTGTYETDDDSIFRAFANAGPQSPGTPRATTQVDLVLPPVAAFYDRKGPIGVFPPLLGQKAARWPEVFACIKRPELCWDVWGPKKTLDQFDSIDDVWSTYAVGEAVYNSAGVQTGVKPPLNLVEKYFHSDWRTTNDQMERKRLQKHWQRFREIPEWIAACSDRQHTSPSRIINDLNKMRKIPDKTKTIRSLNWLAQHVAELRKARAEVTAVTNSTVYPLNGNIYRYRRPYSHNTPSCFQSAISFLVSRNNHGINIYSCSGLRTAIILVEHHCRPETCKSDRRETSGESQFREAAQKIVTLYHVHRT